MQHLRERGYELFDVQMTTEHTAAHGGDGNRTRTSYLQRLRQAVNKSHVRFV